MGYIVPPQPMRTTEDGGTTWIEVTSLGDEHAMFVNGYGEATGRASDDYVERLRQQQHIVQMQEWHRETMLQARIGATILLALIVCIGYGIAQLLGLA